MTRPNKPLSQLENEKFDSEGKVLVNISKDYAIRTATSGDITYVGKADVGSSSSDAVWQIFKVDESSGTVITWADSDNLFDNVWDNYSSLTYG